MSKNYKRKCNYCGKYYENQNDKFCSRKCSIKGQKRKSGAILKNCLFCNKKFKTYQYMIKKGWGNYCSSKCYGKAIKGMHHSVSTEFKKGHSKHKNAYKFLKEKKHWNWQGGKYLSSIGYWLIYNPYHHKASSQGYVKQAIVIAEQKIGRKLKLNEIVHHINGIKHDDRPENLQIMTDKKHKSIEATLMWEKRKNKI